MGIRKVKKNTAARRGITFDDFADITSKPTVKKLLLPKKSSGGRNHRGVITVRHRGGGVKRSIRVVDFKRNKHGVDATVAAIEYDPIRSARIALLQYKDGEKRYILAPVGIKVGSVISSGPAAPPEIGNALPLKAIPVGIAIHNIELTPGHGGRMQITPGSGAQVPAQERLAIGDVAFDIGRHMEIGGGNLETAPIDVGHRHRDADPSQHGRQGTAAAADHQDMAALSLPQKSVHRVDIVGGTDAIAVGDAVVDVFLPKRSATGSVVHFRAMRFRPAFVP